MAKSAHSLREQVEGLVYFAIFCSFARTLTPEPPEDSTSAETSSKMRAKLRDQAIAQVTAARELLTRYHRGYIEGRSDYPYLFDKFGGGFPYYSTTLPGYLQGTHEKPAATRSLCIGQFCIQMMVVHRT
ncbi:hypothetical protein GGR58DRAFT_506130 [Xylaria digitata]|nr:hypothetical protein GGR58DRAFT_506130 [Xylaria digitata]